MHFGGLNGRFQPFLGVFREHAILVENRPKSRRMQWLRSVQLPLASCGRLAKPPFNPLPTGLRRRHSRAILLLGLIATSETLSAPYNGRGSSAAGAHHHRAAADQHTPPPVTRTLRPPGSHFFATTQGRLIMRLIMRLIPLKSEFIPLPRHCCSLLFCSTTGRLRRVPHRTWPHAPSSNLQI